MGKVKDVKRIFKKPQCVLERGDSMQTAMVALAEARHADRKRRAVLREKVSMAASSS